MFLEDRLEIMAQIVYRLAITNLSLAAGVRTMLQKDQRIIAHLQLDLLGILHGSPAAIFLLDHFCPLAYLAGASKVSWVRVPHSTSCCMDQSFKSTTCL